MTLAVLTIRDSLAILSSPTAIAVSSRNALSLTHGWPRYHYG